eukprot:TRINITY_DN12975_c0_g1_i1.p1 TRINITY_DN12975_c0_g1~~TRINITY_DN12975_c0_g1_i1.p1  ORF type:complete len:134 (-),score=19.87 TRINITY_DN12975_c0_g1_i1:258-632(-)
MALAAGTKKNAQSWTPSRNANHLNFPSWEVEWDQLKTQDLAGLTKYSNRKVERMLRYDFHRTVGRDERAHVFAEMEKKWILVEGTPGSQTIYYIGMGIVPTEGFITTENEGRWSNSEKMTQRPR